MTTAARRIVLRRYPQGVPEAADFEILDAVPGTPQSGEVLVQTRWLSMDPVPRLRMRAGVRGALPLGATLVGRGVGVVLESRHPNFAAGDWVAGELGWQDRSVAPAQALRRVDPSLGPVQHALGLLGPSGITAWCLVHRAAKVRHGETVVIAAAAGAVGSVALQLARIEGARTVGLVGGPAQARFVRDTLQAAAVVDHASATLDADLVLACPTGANVFLDSVGGSLHEAVMQRIADHARIVAFGYISTYNTRGSALPEYGRMYELIHRRAVLSGFLIADHAAHFEEALRDLSAHLAAGRVQVAEAVSEGLESVPAAFARLFAADPVGKQLVRLT